jgi:hypothetical protein
MPLYEYYCRPGAGENAHKFEVRQSIKDRGTAVCSLHGMTTTERVISLPALKSGTNTSGEGFAREMRQELFGSSDAPTFTSIKELTRDTKKKLEKTRRELNDLMDEK